MDMQKINAMREGGKILGTILAELRSYVKVGMTKRELDSWVRKKIIDAGASVSYDELPEKFPGAICISVNDELVHGAPNSDYQLQDGDKVSFDLVIGYKGYHTDDPSPTTVGNANPASKQITKQLKKVSGQVLPQLPQESILVILVTLSKPYFAADSSELLKITLVIS